MVALVAADTEEHARAAAKKVKQNLEVLPAYLTFPEAVMPNAIQLHAGIPNFYMEQPVFKGEDTAEIFDDAPVVAEGSFYSQHEPHLTIEPDTLQGYWGTDGMLTLQCKSHNFGETREALASACGIPKENLRMTAEHRRAASFGYTVCPNTFALVVTAVQNLDMPCTLTLSYDEFNHTTGKRMATFTNGRIACDEEGKIIAAEYDVALDHGAYGFVPIFINLTSLGFHGYNIPNFKALGRGGSSNHDFNTVVPRLRRRRRSTPPPRRSSTCAPRRPASTPGSSATRTRRGRATSPSTAGPTCDYVYPKLLEMAKPIYDAVQGRGRSGAGRGPARGRGHEHGRLHHHHRHVRRRPKWRWS